jgi:hydroxypyruvate isomerase
VTLVLEPLNIKVDHPGYYLQTAKEGFEMIDEVGSPALKMLFDIYHHQIMEGNVIADITKNIAKIAHFHVADVPGRHEPGSGEINYANVFRAIASSGYQGFVGLEYKPSRAAEETLRDVLRMSNV